MNDFRNNMSKQLAFEGQIEANLEKRRSYGRNNTLSFNDTKSFVLNSAPPKAAGK